MQKLQQHSILALVGCGLLCQCRGISPNARHPPPPSFGRGISAPPDATPKSTVPTPRRSCKWREGLIVASSTRCPTLAIAPQRPRVHHRWRRPRRAQRVRPPAAPNEERGERSESVDAHQEQKGGERSEPVCQGRPGCAPRRAVDAFCRYLAQNGSAWNHFVPEFHLFRRSDPPNTNRREFRRRGVDLPTFATVSLGRAPGSCWLRRPQS